MRQRRPRQIDADHLAFVRSLPCCICGDDVSVEAAHIRAGDPTVAKRATGMGERPDDAWALPLCGKHHREQHADGERSFWRMRGVDPFRMALALWRVSGDVEAGAQIVSAQR